MFAQATIKLQGPMDHLRLVWQTGETMLEPVAFEVDPEGTRYNVLLALQEMVTNVLRHAYELDERKPLEVTFEVGPEHLQIVLRDQGPAFNPLGFSRAEDEGDVDGVPTAVGGFGICFARSVMDDVTYERVDGWNCLRLTKSLRVVANA